MVGYVTCTYLLYTVKKVQWNLYSGHPWGKKSLLIERCPQNVHNLMWSTTTQAALIREVCPYFGHRGVLIQEFHKYCACIQSNRINVQINGYIKNNTLYYNVHLCEQMSVL